MAQAKQDMGSGSVKKLMLQLMIPAVMPDLTKMPCKKPNWNKPKRKRRVFLEFLPNAKRAKTKKSPRPARVSGQNNAARVLSAKNSPNRAALLFTARV